MVCIIWLDWLRLLFDVSIAKSGLDQVLWKYGMETVFRRMGLTRPVRRNFPVGLF